MGESREEKWQRGLNILPKQNELASADDSFAVGKLGLRSLISYDGRVAFQAVITFSPLPKNIFPLGISEGVCGALFSAN